MTDDKPKLEKLKPISVTMEIRRHGKRGQMQVTVAGWGLGQFGIAEYPPGLGIDGWSVTHLATGMCLQGYSINTKRRAIQLLRLAHDIVGDADLFAKNDEAESTRQNLRTAVYDWERKQSND